MEQTVRRGGVQTSTGFLFELTGGDVSLDLANTVDLRPTHEPKELIPGYVDLLSWAKQSKLLSSFQEAGLRRIAKRKPEEAESVRRKAVEIRECLFQVFSHLADGKKIPDLILHQTNRIVADCQARYDLVPTRGGGFSWQIRTHTLKLDAPIWPVVQSAIQLLTGPHASRIRKCDGENCNWVFLDTSKRGNRRWCDMTVCGNRAKARAYYARKKELTEV